MAWSKEKLKRGALTVDVILLIAAVLPLSAGIQRFPYEGVIAARFIAHAIELIIFGLLGLYVIVKESRKGLNVMAIIWGFGTLSVIALIAWEVFSFTIVSAAKPIIERSFLQYGSDQLPRELSVHLVDAIQIELSCCGLDSYKDWNYFLPWSRDHPRNVPDSCCITYEPGCGEGKLLNTDGIYTRGCSDLMNSNTMLIIVICVGLLGIALMVSAVVLFRKLAARVLSPTDGGAGTHYAVIQQNRGPATTVNL